MINPNKEYGPITGVVLSRDGVAGKFIIEGANRCFDGWDLPKRFKEGDKVTFRIQFYITCDSFKVISETVRKKAK
jgi:hypothetical protein